MDTRQAGWAWKTGKITSILVLVLAGFVLFPRQIDGKIPFRLISSCLSTVQPAHAPVDRIRRDLREGCAPILEGSDTLDGREAYAIRLKPPHKRYPWLEVWIDKRTSTILAWKEWGIRDDQVTVLSQSPRLADPEPSSGLSAPRP